MSSSTGTGPADASHVPVLLDRVLDVLEPALTGERPVVVDTTLGLGRL